MPVGKMQMASNISCLSAPCILLSELLVLLPHCTWFCLGSLALSMTQRTGIQDGMETRVFQVRLRGLVCVQSNTIIGGRSLESRGTLTCRDKACDHECF